MAPLYGIVYRILRDLLANRPVTLSAVHPVWRGYAHVNDELSIAMGLLLAGHSPPVFDSWGSLWRFRPGGARGDGGGEGAGDSEAGMERWNAGLLYWR